MTASEDFCERQAPIVSMFEHHDHEFTDVKLQVKVSVDPEAYSGGEKNGTSFDIHIKCLPCRRVQPKRKSNRYRANSLTFTSDNVPGLKYQMPNLARDLYELRDSNYPCQLSSELGFRGNSTQWISLEEALPGVEVRLAQDWGSLFILGLSYDDYAKIDSDYYWYEDCDLYLKLDYRLYG